MGAPESGMQAADQATADELLTALRTIKQPERARHAMVLDYWLSIRGDKEFPPLHDLDPLEISDAGPSSILLELISGGQDAQIRHIGEALRDGDGVDRIIDAPNPSILTAIAKKLPIVAISRDFLAFEDSFDLPGGGWTRCWVTLLPLSSCGSWVDYVYAFVSTETGGKASKKPEPAAPAQELPPAEVANADDAEELTPPEAIEEPAEPEPLMLDEPVAEIEEIAEAVEEAAPAAEIEPHEPVVEQSVEEPPARGAPGFSKLIEGIASLTGFYGQGVKIDDPVVEVGLPVSDPLPPEPEAAEAESVPEAVEPRPEQPAAIDEPVALEEPAIELAVPEEPVAEDMPPELTSEPEPESAPEPESETVEAPTASMEGNLQTKLNDVRAKADEARAAQLRATAAIHEGLSAAYDFALDAETSPEEYLRLIEAQGLKIQLRAPMAPVARLAFEDVCDAATIRQFEAVLAWALKVELPRGALLERIQSAGGIPELLNEFSKAA